MASEDDGLGARSFEHADIAWIACWTDSGRNPTVFSELGRIVEDADDFGVVPADDRVDQRKILHGQKENDRVPFLCFLADLEDVRGQRGSAVRHHLGEHLADSAFAGFGVIHRMFDGLMHREDDDRTFFDEVEGQEQCVAAHVFEGRGFDSADFGAFCPLEEEFDGDAGAGFELFDHELSASGRRAPVNVAEGVALGEFADTTRFEASALRSSRVQVAGTPTNEGMNLFHHGKGGGIDHELDGVGGVSLFQADQTEGVGSSGHQAFPSVFASPHGSEPVTGSNGLIERRGDGEAGVRSLTTRRRGSSSVMRTRGRLRGRSLQTTTSTLTGSPTWTAGEV